jgi:hypothetical protein
MNETEARRSAGFADGKPKKEPYAPQRKATDGEQSDKRQAEIEERNDAIREIHAFLEAVLAGERPHRELWRVRNLVRGPVRSGVVGKFIKRSGENHDATLAAFQFLQLLLDMSEDDRLGRIMAVNAIFEGTLAVDSTGAPVAVQLLNERVRAQEQQLSELGNVNRQQLDQIAQLQAANDQLVSQQGQQWPASPREDPSEQEPEPESGPAVQTGTEHGDTDPRIPVVQEDQPATPTKRWKMPRWLQKILDMTQQKEQ